MGFNETASLFMCIIKINITFKALTMFLCCLKLLIYYRMSFNIFCFVTIYLACKSDGDCNSHGDCNINKHTCTCQPEFTGGQCEKKTSKLFDAGILEDDTPCINI